MRLSISISGGADVQDIAAATFAAAEDQMADASSDAAVKNAVRLLTQIPTAARKEDFASEAETRFSAQLAATGRRS